MRVRITDLQPRDLGARAFGAEDQAEMIDKSRSQLRKFGDGGKQWRNTSPERAHLPGGAGHRRKRSAFGTCWTPVRPLLRFPGD